MGIAGFLPGNCRVLVVEDNFYLADDARRALMRAGATVVGPCAHVEDCVSLLELDPPDCAVVDINLGNGPSFEIPRLLRERRIPFIFLTGYDAEVVPAEFADIPRLAKPLMEPPFLKAVGLLCGGSNR